MTLRAHWEIAAIPDSLFQGVLLASLPEAPEEMEVLITRTQNLTSHHCSVQHQAADMLLLWWLKPACCWGKVGCLQAWQLPVCNSPHPTLRKTLKKLQLLCMFFPDASATSRAPEPNQAPQEITQLRELLSTTWLLLRGGSAIWGCPIAGKSWSKLHYADVMEGKYSW